VKARRQRRISDFQLPNERRLGYTPIRRTNYKPIENWQAHYIAIRVIIAPSVNNNLQSMPAEPERSGRTAESTH
ncbi:MAG: hypothetical protein MZV65_41675, partial [Chromatiales bacterium]|nr:hypothetical protein [Chromatiales bacterium]